MFGGARGWEAKSRIDALGIEWDPDACATSLAAGFRTLEADVAALDPLDFAPCVGLIASAPCQAFSNAGLGAGRAAMAAYEEAIAAMADGREVDWQAIRGLSSDERGHLVLEPLRWALALRPRWIALEQVEPVMPLWQAMAAALRDKGYSAWCGVLSAERYGVPQTRRRAILIASLDREVSEPPPTHQRYVAPTRRAEATDALFAAPEPERIVLPEDRGLLPWVSMAQALGWDGGAYRLARGEGISERHGDRPPTPMSEPAPTISTKVRTATWVQTNNFTAIARDPDGKRSKAGSVPYERSVDDPAPTVDTSAAGWKLRSGQSVAGEGRAERPIDEPALTVRGTFSRGVWVNERPATTVNCDPRVAEPGRHDPAQPGSQYGAATVRVTIAEAAVLQSFPPDWPWQGTKTARFRQVGNAIPPLLAWHVLKAVRG